MEEADEKKKEKSFSLLKKLLKYKDIAMLFWV